jgi:hypothetical protein
MNKMALIPVSAVVAVCCLLTGCAKKEKLEPAQVGQSAETAVDIDAPSSVPPLDLLKSNCQIATHIALVNVTANEIADSIFADDGTLGYVIEKSTAEVVKPYRGDFGESPQIQFSNFLEYPTAPVNTRMDSQLVFLNRDSTDASFHVIEVGQFPYSDSLGKIMSVIGCED